MSSSIFSCTVFLYKVFAQNPQNVLEHCFSRLRPMKREWSADFKAKSLQKSKGCSPQPVHSWISEKRSKAKERAMMWGGEKYKVRRKGECLYSTSDTPEPEFLNILKWQLGWKCECKVSNKSPEILNVKFKCVSLKSIFMFFVTVYTK